MGKFRPGDDSMTMASPALWGSSTAGIETPATVGGGETEEGAPGTEEATPSFAVRSFQPVVKEPERENQEEEKEVAKQRQTNKTRGEAIDEEALIGIKMQIHRETRNMHVEMLRSFHLQRRETEKLQDKINELTHENSKLRNKMGYFICLSTWA
jgi:hypothetical protein